MHDRWAVALAVAVVAGALRPSGTAVLAALAVAAAGLVARRPWLLCLGGALLASGALAQRSLDGLEGVRAAAVDAPVTLLTDPAPFGSRLEAEVRLGHRHLLAEVRAAEAGTLGDRLAGEHLVVHGQLVPLDHPDGWTRSRHLAGRLQVERWEPGSPPGVVARAANAVRRSLDRGAVVLGARRASLFSGLVIGDDRDQPPDLADEFRGAGLSHLLVVSGENVAFVLALVGPLGRRLRLWPRLGMTLLVIGGFALLTRFEPSVTRAAAMAALAATTTTVGRPTSRVRLLALAVAGLVLVDPMLTRSVGFLLSVAAVLAILLAAEPIAAALPGPRWLAEPLGVTLAAQLGVAPLLLVVFGPLPLASIPANLLAVPAAGAVMVWGMTVGPIAGLLPTGAAALLHGPTRLLVWWIDGVAARSSRAPLGQVGAVGVAALGVGLLLVVGGRRRGPAPRRVGGLLVLAVVFTCVVSAQRPPPLRTALAPGVVRWHLGATEVLALGGGGWQTPLDARSTLEVLRTARVGAIDVVVAVTADVPASVIDAVRAGHPAAVVLVPPDLGPADRPAGATVLPADGTALRLGRLDVLIRPGVGRFAVEAWPAPA